MKKVVAIGLVILMIFNSLGYYAVLLHLEFVHDETQKRKLATDQYIGSDAVIIKIPASVPYARNDNHYTPAVGKFIHNNETYRLVKKRFINDTLFIVCVKDKYDQELREKVSDYAKLISDSPQDGKKNLNFIRFTRDYLLFSLEVQHETNGWKRS